MRLRIAVAFAFALALTAPASAVADVYNVSNTNDVAAQDPSTGCATPAMSAAGGACTLRSAVQAANQVNGQSTINVAAGTYKLTIAPSGGDDDSTGDLNVFNTTGKITINGAGSGTNGTIVDGNFTDRVFALDDQTDVEIAGVRIQNGRTGGLGSGNTCTGAATNSSGGGIQTSGDLTLTNDVITGNMTTNSGGGVAHDGNGNLIITSTTFDGNVACPGDSPFSEGGGVAVNGFSSPTISIDRSTFSNNRAVGNSSSGGGAAIFLNASITRSTFSGNSANRGGGVYFAGEGPQLTVYRSTFADNTAANTGAGIENFFGQLSVVNSTFDRNEPQISAAGAGPGIGVIASAQGSNTISYSTFTNSDTNFRSYSDGKSSGGGFTFSNSIVTGSPGSNCSEVSSGTIASNGHNLFDDDGSECNAIASDLKSKDPMLGPLQNNGGPTQTRALLKGSPAIDGGESDECSTTAKSEDQRAVHRPQGPLCDIGAYEYVAADLVLKASVAKDRIKPGDTDTVTDVVTNQGPSTATKVQFTQAVDPDSDYTINSVTTSQGTCTHTAKKVTCSLGSIPADGKVTIKIVLTANAEGTITLKSSVAGAEPDPTPSNNHATVRIDVVAPPPPPPPGCTDRRSFTFTFPSDHEDRTASDRNDLDEGHITTVLVYVDGKQVATRHGRDIHTITIDHHHPPKKGTHAMKVVGLLDNGFRVEIRRVYHGCSNGKTVVRIFRPKPDDPEDATGGARAR